MRTVFEEVVPTYYESGNGAVNWRYLPETNEAIWFSERNNWGNLYLYDLTSGKLKRAITKGDGNVTEVLKVDPKTRTVWFRGVGRTAGVNPYYQQFFKVSLDGGKPVLLTPEAADHTVTLSPDGRHFVDAYSTTTTPPVTVLRSSDDGRNVASVATADISRLKAAGWVPPIPFTVKGRDGKTDLYGVMFKPTNFDASKKYPIIDYIYPGPQTGSVRGRSFLPAHGDNQSLAENASDSRPTTTNTHVTNRPKLSATMTPKLVPARSSSVSSRPAPMFCTQPCVASAFRSVDATPA